jgi:hypothetical protein
MMAAGLVATLLLAGCGLLTPPSPASLLRFQFTPITGPGYMSQTLTIYNDSARMVAPTLEFAALDATGRPLPTVGSPRSTAATGDGWSSHRAAASTC